MCRELEWATAIFGVGSRYYRLYYDTAGLDARQGGAIRPSKHARRGEQQDAATRPAMRATRSACAQEQAAARAAWPQGCVVIQFFCIVIGGLRHGATARACVRRHDRRRAVTRRPASGVRAAWA